MKFFMLAGALFMFAPLAALAAAPPTFASPPPVAIPAPSALHYTTNVSTCAAHGGTTSACEALAKQGTVAVYGSWDCANCAALSGYQLKVPGLPGVVRDGKTIFWILPEPSSGWKGLCYVAVAYRQTVVSGEQESPPSAPACINQTTIQYTIPASVKRSYSRTYSILYSSNVPQVQTAQTHSSDPLITGDYFLVQDGFSQTNNFYRAAVSFSRSSLQDVSVFGGVLAYDGQVCSYLYAPAPSGWESAQWIKPAYDANLNVKWVTSGAGGSANLDAYLRAWPMGKQLTFVFEPTETPEVDKSGLVPPSFSCPGSVSNARLIVTIGVNY